MGETLSQTDIDNQSEKSQQNFLQYFSTVIISWLYKDRRIEVEKIWRVSFVFENCSGIPTVKQTLNALTLQFI